MNEKQRGPYEESAAKDKKRYEEEKANYNVSLTVRINAIKQQILWERNIELNNTRYRPMPRRKSLLRDFF